MTSTYLTFEQRNAIHDLRLNAMAPTYCARCKKSGGDLLTADQCV